MKESANGNLGGKVSVAFFAGLTALIVYMSWIGITGHPLPRWVLWATTFL